MADSPDGSLRARLLEPPITETSRATNAGSKDTPGE